DTVPVVDVPKDIILNQTDVFGDAVSTYVGRVNLSGKNVTLVSAGNLSLGKITATGNLSISADGDISNVQTVATDGQLKVTGTTTFDATLGTANNTITI